MATGLWPDSVLSRGCCQAVMARERVCSISVVRNKQPPVSLFSGLALCHLLTLTVSLGQCAMSTVLSE